MLVDRVRLAGMAAGCEYVRSVMTRGNHLERIVRSGSGSVVTWRRAQMLLWSAQGMSVAQIAGLAFTSEDRGPRRAAQPHCRRLRLAVRPGLHGRRWKVTGSSAG